MYNFLILYYFSILFDVLNEKFGLMLVYSCTNCIQATSYPLTSQVQKLCGNAFSLNVLRLEQYLEIKSQGPVFDMF